MVLLYIAMKHSPNSKFLAAMVLLSVMGSLLPLFVTALVFPDLSESRLVSFGMVLLFPITWMVLVLMTVAYGNWQRKLWQLFWLIPIAFADPLLLLWGYYIASTGRFAP